MTLRNAQARIRALGMVLWRTDYGDYRVAFPRSCSLSLEEIEAKAYYTDDLDDAVATATLIACPKTDSGHIWFSRDGSPMCMKCLGRRDEIL